MRRPIARRRHRAHPLPRQQLRPLPSQRGCTIPTPATEPVPPTITGPTTAYVPSTQSKLPVIPISAAASIGGKVSAKITGIKTIKQTARLPGEISGLALAVSVQLSNESVSPVDLSSVMVEVQDHAGVPASPVSSVQESRFAGSLGAKKTAAGVYLFTAPSSNSNPITIGVSYSNGAPLARFVGDAN